MVKIGRRGSLNARLTVSGTQGHTAYPQLADNPLHHLARMLNALVSEPLDGGNAHFPPSSLQLTSVDVGKRSEEHTSELQSLMRTSYAVFCLKKKKHCNTLN